MINPPYALKRGSDACQQKNLGVSVGSLCLQAVLKEGSEMEGIGGSGWEG